MMVPPQGELRIKRVYDPAAGTDGYRVLVDRLWPRGMTRERAELDLWLGSVAPSTRLRAWWHHEPERQPEFTARYVAELDSNPAVARLLEILGSHPVVTLLYAARDSRVNHAAVLRDYLSEHASEADAPRSDSRSSPPSRTRTST
jgi:uncharacterized protein YeaO (DUF488 family)